MFDRFDVIAFVEVLQIEVARGLGRPQPHVIHGLGPVAGHRCVVRHGHHVFGAHPVDAQTALVVDRLLDVPAELHRIEHLGARELPGIAVPQPVVRMFDLVAVLDALPEHAVLIADTVTVAGQRERGHGVEKTSREPAESTIAKRRVLFQFADLVDVQLEVRERPAAFLIEPHVQQAVGQETPRQKLERQVIDTLGVGAVVALGGRRPALDQLVSDGVGSSREPVMRRRGREILAE